MGRSRTFLLIAGIFLATSGILYGVHYAVFRDSLHIRIFLLGDLAFLPLEVFLVVIVIERSLARRDKQAIRQKLNMVIGAFFSEVGTRLLHSLIDCFDDRESIATELAIRQDWTRANFRRAAAVAGGLHRRPDCQRVDLPELKALLVAKRGFLLRLLENPNLMEHERFTDLLWATFHLTEELEARESLDDLPPSDFSHISVDIDRLYTRLAVEWVHYAEHLQASYPFLFSLLTRTHPFQAHPSAVVTE